MAKIPEKMRWIYDLLLTAAILATATVLRTIVSREAPLLSPGGHVT